jgi:flagellin
MLELGNVLNVIYGANVIMGAYSRVGEDSTEVLDDGAVSVIQYLLRGEESQQLEDERYANEAISTAQDISAFASSINDKYERMKELAEMAASGDYTAEEVAEFQDEFEQLGDEINELVESSEFNGNKLFTWEGTTISVSIGNGSSIDIFAEDLSIDIEGLDLTTDPEGALGAIGMKAGRANYYAGYIEEQIGRLEGAVELIEFERYNGLGVEAEEFDTELAGEVAGFAATQTLEALSELFGVQANVEPERALQLLADRMEELSEEDTE